MTSRHPDREAAVNPPMDLEACCTLLSRMALGETVDTKEKDLATRMAIRAVRNAPAEVSERLLELFRATLAHNDVQLTCRYQALLSNHHLQRANYELALSHAREGRDLAVGAHLEDEASLCSAFAGSACQWIGRFQEAADWFDEALVAARRSGDISLEASALSSRALLSMLTGEASTALAQIERSVTLYAQLGDTRQQARCGLNRGIFLSKLGRLVEAESVLRASLATLETNGLENYANSARLGLSRVLRLTGSREESKSLIELVLKAADQNFDLRTRVIAMEYLSDLSIDAGHFGDAESVLSNALGLAQEVGPKSDLYLECCYRLAFARAHIGTQSKAALSLASWAVVEAETRGDLFELAASLYVKGACQLRDGSPSDARASFMQSLELAGRIGDQLTRAAVSLALSKVLSADSAFLEALGLAMDARRTYQALPSPRLFAEADAWLTELTLRLPSSAAILVSAESTKRARRSRTRIDASPIPGIPEFISGNPRVRQLLLTTLKLSPRGLSMLVLGETGTGKELVAEAIHHASNRSGPFVPVNCGALPGDLLEAELFGHARGAYTGADRERGGLIEYSHLGTLFLDEIGDMPLKAQARLLRAIEKGEIRRLGENSPRLVNLRIVAATHRNLLEMVSGGEFRLDLYHRLSGFVITLPPLRERGNDVELLIDRFLEVYAKEQDKPVHLSPEVRELLTRHAWPGNVRQLRNVIHRVVSLSEPGQVVHELPFELEGAGAPRSLPEALDAEERRRIVDALNAAGWNKAKAAAALGASRTTLIGKMKRLGIESPVTGARVR